MHLQSYQSVKNSRDHCHMVGDIFLPCHVTGSSGYAWKDTVLVTINSCPRPWSGRGKSRQGRDAGVSGMCQAPSRWGGEERDPLIKISHLKVKGPCIDGRVESETITNRLLLICHPPAEMDGIQGERGGEGKHVYPQELIICWSGGDSPTLASRRPTWPLLINTTRY